jgi:hypothetical protein
MQLLHLTKSKNFNQNQNEPRTKYKIGRKSLTFFCPQCVLHILLLPLCNLYNDLNNYNIQNKMCRFEDHFKMTKLYIKEQRMKW